METLPIFDSHAHYDSHNFDEDRKILLNSFPSKGIVGIVNVGCSEKSNVSSIALAEEYPFFYCTVGIHPEDSQKVALHSNGYIDLLAEQSKHPKVKAIGEIGLDYYYDDASPRETQLVIFEQQLALAKDLNLPVVIHNRDAHNDTLAILKKYRPKGIMHCFSGSAEVAQEVVKLGMYVGFTGVVTFKNARKALEAVAAVPQDRLLVETDCPYMAPEPFRGTRCDSSMLPRMIEKIAEIKGIDAQTMAQITVQNAYQVYSI